MANLRDSGGHKPASRKNHVRFYTALDMAELKHMEAIRNSRVKRGEEKEKHTYISCCGCGREGCFIVSAPRKIDYSLYI
jgi:hypothetical protein